MRIAILGAGGVGGYYGGLLSRDGHDVRLLARGDNLTALRERGLDVRTPEGNWVATVAAADDTTGIGDVDLVVVAVKSYSLDDVANATIQLADRGAIVLPLLNGVDVADRLVSAGVPRSQLLGGITYISAARIAPGTIERRSPFQRVIVGELDGGLSPRAQRVAEAFRHAGADASATADIGVAIWQKFVFLASCAAVCGLVNAPIGVVRERPLGRRLIERAVAEVAALARARGVALPDEEEARASHRMLVELPPSMKPSLLLDLEAGGPNELDALSGAVSRMGEAAGVATPVHDTAVAVLSRESQT
jgi:2-dehydropantoate 2-reductase